MKELCAGKLIVKKSRFYSHLYLIEKLEDVEEILNIHIKLYKKANHHCYSMILRTVNNELIEKFVDDGEVGYPGRILLELLKNNDFDHHMLIVSRVFGGTKLGVSGVSRAFRSSGNSVIKHYKSKKLYYLKNVNK
jgi:putative IMPACT (imprinted ancient) family translation regulator